MAVILSWAADDFTPSSGSWEVKGTGTVIDTSVKNEGTGSMKLVCAGGTPDDGDRGLKELNGAGVFSMEFGGEYYHGWDMKFDAAFSWASANKLKANRWTRSAGITNFMTGYLGVGGVWPGEHSDYGFNSDQGAGSGGEGPYIDYDFEPDTNTAITNFQRYVVAFKIQSSEGASDGWMRLYVNGTLIGAITGIIWFTGDDAGLEEVWAAFMMMCFPQTATGNLWIDNVIVATTFDEANAGAGVGSPDGGGGLSIPVLANQYSRRRAA